MTREVNPRVRFGLSSFCHLVAGKKLGISLSNLVFKAQKESLRYKWRANRPATSRWPPPTVKATLRGPGPSLPSWITFTGQSLALNTTKLMSFDLCLLSSRLLKFWTEQMSNSFGKPNSTPISKKLCLRSKAMWKKVPLVESGWTS